MHVYQILTSKSRATKNKIKNPSKSEHFFYTGFIIMDCCLWPHKVSILFYSRELNVVLRSGSWQQRLIKGCSLCLQFSFTTQTSLIILTIWLKSLSYYIRAMVFLNSFVCNFIVIYLCWRGAGAVRREVWPNRRGWVTWG